MIPIPADDQKKKKKAFALFEDGRYTESLQLCREILSREKDQAIEILTATNLFSSGNYEEAESHFRDLSLRMPDSSYVHSYLARVLDARGDETAVAEYAIAVHLDPANQEALRNFATYLLAHRDFRGALPLLRRLVQATKRKEDIRSLMQALTESGEPDEALAAYGLLGEAATVIPEYIDALLATGQYRAAVDAARTLWQATKEPETYARYLDALSRCDLPAAIGEGAEYLLKNPEPAVILVFIQLLRAGEMPSRALSVLRSQPGLAATPAGRLTACELLAKAGEVLGSLAAYEDLIRDELAAKDDLEFLQKIISQYRTLLISSRGPADARTRFTAIVSQDANVASLIETGRFFEDLRDLSEARSWYYRAYRADFLAGGIAYARFLAHHNEDRECEKVMLYMVRNIKKGSDLVRVARVALDRDSKMHRLPRLMDLLIHRFRARQASLDSEGRDLLAMAFFLAASNALETMDTLSCKHWCLAGIDVLPVPPKALRLEDFLDLLRACKARAVADRPALAERPVKSRRDAKTLPDEPPEEVPDLTEQERSILAFLRVHRKASEIDLRTLLGTRRVVGVVNQLIRKASDAGVPLIRKTGAGDEGETYEYTGT